ncbi:sensor histidine kinase [Candidatus Nomurabacteria bacterium]|nr:sensor histidine kinase [Candidatus Nomurabacteria bacterium]
MSDKRVVDQRVVVSAQDMGKSVEREAAREKLSLDTILKKLREYKILIHASAEAVRTGRYDFATRMIDSLKKTPVLFESFPEEIKQRYVGHDLFHDYYNLVVGFIEAMEDALKPHNGERDDEGFHLLYNRLVDIYELYEAIMESLVVRSYNVEQKKAQTENNNYAYKIPEAIGDEQIMEEKNIEEIKDLFELFLQTYKKRITFEKVNIFRQGQNEQVKVAQGVLFNVFRNILGNLTYAQRQKMVRAKNISIGMYVHPELREFVIEVCDDGVGMDKAMQKMLFREGVSGSESTGLGLAHADELIASMGGKISVQSKESKQARAETDDEFNARPTHQMREVLVDVDEGEYNDFRQSASTVFTITLPLM